MEKHRKRIESLLKQQQKISTQLEETRRQHNDELFKIFSRLPIHTVVPDVLVGGLQFICQEATKNSPTVEGWRRAGEKFRGKRSAHKTSTASY